jgi:hypothetical protein
MHEYYLNLHALARIGPVKLIHSSSDQLQRESNNRLYTLLR